MSIYPHRLQSIPTGLWRVELNQQGRKYRKLHALHGDAIRDEQAVMAVWARGGELQDSIRPLQTPNHHNLISLRYAAHGTLWADDAEPCINWAQVGTAASIVGVNQRLNSLDTSTIDKLVKGLKGRGKTDTAINRYLSHFRSLLAWGVERKMMDRSMFAAMKWRGSVERIRWITQEEEAQLQQHLPHNVWQFVRVAIETGCLREELLSVEPHDITVVGDGDALHLCLRTPGTKRSVLLSRETGAMLRELLSDGTRPTPRALSFWWDRARTKAGLEYDDQFVFHACRHTCAIRMVERDISLSTIQALMGHKELVTTKRYAQAWQEHLARELERLRNEALISRANPRMPVNIVQLRPVG